MMGKSEQSDSNKRVGGERGFSLIELGVVCALMAIITAMALPQLAGHRRLVRSAAVSKQLMMQLRDARQRAMGERKCFTVEYDNINKQILIIDNNASGSAVLNDPNYPNTAGSAVVETTSLTADGGLSASEIFYGIPSDIPDRPLADGTTKASLINGKVDITFQSDGTVIDGTGSPTDQSLFLYNSKAPHETAAAVSVIGSSGRVKIWKYSDDGRAYVE